MNTRIFVMTLSLCLGLNHLDAQQTDPAAPETVVGFQWSGDDMDVLNQSPAFNDNRYQQSVDVGGVVGQPTQLSVHYALSTPLQLTIRTLGSAITSRVTSRHYAISGKISYEGVSPGSYLEMWSYFAPATSGGPEGAYFSRTLGYSGPMARMEGTDDGRDFLLPFDASGTTAQLERIEFNLHLTGSGTVHLWSVKLVQYPDAPATGASSASTPGTNPLAEGNLTIGVTMLGQTVNYSLKGMGNIPLDNLRQMLKAPGVAGSSRTFSIVAEKEVPYPALKALLDVLREAGISHVEVSAVDSPPPLPNPSSLNSTKFDGRSFLLGILSTLAGILVAVGLFTLIRRLRHHRHERELRRIASLDS